MIPTQNAHSVRQGHSERKQRVATYGAERKAPPKRATAVTAKKRLGQNPPLKTNKPLKFYDE